MTRMLWHSNAPWSPTGYGQQTALFTPHLSEQYSLHISSFYGLEGAPRSWKGIPVLPGLGGDFGSQSLIAHANRVFAGNPRGGLVLTLMDVWVLEAAAMRQLNVASWVPVDHDPAPPRVIEFFAESGAVPIAMSRFGERLLTDAGLEPLYVPHGVDTSVYKPVPRETARHGAFPEGAFVVGMVAANKGRPSRKSFAQAFEAMSVLMAEHDNVFFYLHTALDPNLGQGENLGALIKALGIPMERVRIADQYAMTYEPYDHEQMAQIYSALDVLLNPAMGEGFGIPVLEAQACGVPVIVTDFSAMTEVCGSGWQVDSRRVWTGQNSWQAQPDVADILEALEACLARTPVQRQKMQDTATTHAAEYDVLKVFKQFWLPALREVEERFQAREPVRVPSRLEATA